MIAQTDLNRTGVTASENWLQTNQRLHQLLHQNNQPELALNMALEILINGEFQARWEVAKVFPKLGEKAIFPLMDILNDEEADLESRWFAGRILGEFNHPEVIASLVNLLQTTKEEELAAIAANALANLGNASIEVLSDLLPQPDSRRLATFALAQIRHPGVIDPLLTVVKDENALVRATAIEALSSFNDPRVPSILLEGLNDPAAIVRKEAVTGLGLKSEQAEELDLITHLQPLLYDLNLEVCQQSALALGRLASDAAAKALLSVLKSPLTPIPLQTTLIQSLGWMETPVSLDYLQQALPYVAPESILEIIRILGRVENPDLKAKAAQSLLDFFYSGHPMIDTPPIKRALAYAWGQLEATTAVFALEQLTEDADAGVRIHAISALKSC
ncbi:PBS lyase HEAT domain protein repeat-containing protein [Gloeothece citriformis PCC 7424]|uniref:PBS lyase HEAT domain protein repeat-containing protein n=1 Tax=Gloeothece citriformis (strain PCC 7424) TaxID=65393 RepID=B7KB07_GLOC7|nr:HEAT repeat domain-containing protein [Gloeothece citriformis]ACK70117.1 PBS lyase HEAT domain protein repeat-containing protein [Gloeothece citriformis PCC 7424]